MTSSEFALGKHLWPEGVKPRESNQIEILLEEIGKIII